MKKKLTHAVILCCMILSLSACKLFHKTNTEAPFTTSKEKNEFPKPLGYVSDFENIFTSEEELQLTNFIKEHEKQTTDQIAIVTIASTSPYLTMEEYTVKIAKYWNVGGEDKNGVIVIVSKTLRSINIKLYSGVESRFAVADSKEIIDNILIPNFQRGNFYPGILKGLDAITSKLRANN